jgi:hypothetical protein
MVIKINIVIRPSDGQRKRSAKELPPNITEADTPETDNAQDGYGQIHSH